MARRAMMTAALAMVLGLGALAGVGLALPWEQVRGGREALRQAGHDRAEQVFAAHWQAAVAGGRAPAQPLATCPACIQAAAGRTLDPDRAREYCGAACGLEP